MGRRGGGWKGCLVLNPGDPGDLCVLPLKSHSDDPRWHQFGSMREPQVLGDVEPPFYLPRHGEIVTPRDLIKAGQIVASRQPGGPVVDIDATPLYGSNADSGIDETEHPMAMESKKQKERTQKIRREVQEIVRNFVLSMPPGTEFTPNELSEFIYDRLREERPETVAATSRFSKSTMLDPLSREGLIEDTGDRSARSARNKPMATWRRLASESSSVPVPEPLVTEALYALVQRYPEDYAELVDQFSGRDRDPRMFWAVKRAEMARQRYLEAQAEVEALEAKVEALEAEAGAEPAEGADAEAGDVVSGPVSGVSGYVTPDADILMLDQRTGRPDLDDLQRDPTMLG